MIPTKLYNQCLAVMPRVCVDIVLRQGHKVLLLKRIIEPCKGEWCLPGGGIDRGVSPEDMAITKLFEELGIRLVVGISPLELICVDDIVHPMRHDICITYKVRLNREVPIRLDYQHNEYGWFDIDQLPTPMSDVDKRQIEASRKSKR